MANFSLPRLINQNSSMQAALPAIEINRVFNLMGIGVEIVNWIAIVLIALSIISLVFSLFQSLSSRVHELSLLRVLGYRPIGIFGLILSEGLIIALLGGFVGIALAKVGQKLLSDYAVNAFRYRFEYGLSADDVYLMLFALITGIIASLLPAIRAYTQSVVLTIQKAF